MSAARTSTYVPTLRQSARGAQLHWLLGSAALVVALACLLLPSSASAQGTPVGCSYGTGGPHASSLCWLDMTDYDDALARSPAGQRMSVTLQGGYVASFTVTSRPVPGAAQYPPVLPRAVPIETRFAFGTAGYAGVQGEPALYSEDIGPDHGVALSLSDISVVDAAGREVTGYSFVIADTENNITFESFTWTSDEPLDLIGVLNPTSGRGCQNGLQGIGTTTVTCTGTSGAPPTEPRPWYDSVIVGADTPRRIGLSMRTPFQSGVGFAIMTSKIQVTKQVVGRVRASDSYVLSARSPENSLLASARTGPDNSVTTGELTVLPRPGTGGSYTLTEEAEPGTRLADYSQSWSCTKNGAPDPSLPSGDGTSVTVLPQPGDHIACTITNTQRPADLSIMKTAATSPVVPGRNATFRMVVTNNGPSRATNVRVSDELPGDFEFASASPGCTATGGTLACTAGDMDPGTSQTFSVTGRVASSLDQCLDNTATVTSDTPDNDLSNNSSAVCAPIRGESDLSITKESSTARVPVGGGQVMYTLVVEKRGASDDRDVTVTDALPAGLTLVTAEASQGSCTTANNTVSCELGTLKEGGSAQVLVTANTTGTPGCITNTARVRGAVEDSNPTDNEGSAQVCVPPPPPPTPPTPPTPPAPATGFDLTVSKTANLDRVTVGQRLTYTIVVTNHGPDAAPGVKLTDTFNRRASVVSVTTTAGSCSKAIPIRCELGTIAPGASVTVTVVIKPRASGRAQRNAVSVTGCCGADTTPDNNLDSVDANVRKVALRLSKVASRSSVAAGLTLNYRIRMRNPSKGEARNVTVCDRLPAGLSFVSSSPKARRSGGQRCWTIKSLKAGGSRRFRVTVRVASGANGRKVNRASLTSPDTKRLRAKDAVRVLGVASPVTG